MCSREHSQLYHSHSQIYHTNVGESLKTLRDTAQRLLQVKSHDLWLNRGCANDGWFDLSLRNYFSEADSWCRDKTWIQLPFRYNAADDARLTVTGGSAHWTVHWQHVQKRIWNQTTHPVVDILPERLSTTGSKKMYEPVALCYNISLWKWIFLTHLPEKQIQVKNAAWGCYASAWQPPYIQG